MKSNQSSPLSLWERAGVRAHTCLCAKVDFCQPAFVSRFAILSTAMLLSACATLTPAPLPAGEGSKYDIRQCIAGCREDGKTVVVCDNAQPNVMIVPACVAPDKGVQARLEQIQ